jgi:hypothetical protein
MQDNTTMTGDQGNRTWDGCFFNRILKHLIDSLKALWRNPCTGRPAIFESDRRTLNTELKDQ